MKMHRLAIITFEREIEEATHLSATVGDVEIVTSPVTFKGQPDKRCLMVATIGLESCPYVSDDGFLTVPELPRCKCEWAIESSANMLSVLARRGRKISSATPCVAFSDISDEDQIILNRAKSIRASFIWRCAANEPLELLKSDLPNSLADRLPGLALLAEAMSNRHVVGRFREFLRFFEFAFARKVSQIEKKLAQFLKGAELGYTHEEVKSWLALRDGATHGDLKKAQTLIMEPDVRPFISRIEQASYDVLFNKAEWHSPSRERRETLRHTVATTDMDSGNLQITQGRAASLEFQITDPFGAFPMALDAILTSPPEGWWWVEPAEPTRR
jgi:hypothetical protein